MSDLERSDSILLRAMDDSMNLQPQEMYWSVLGMMNNPWFRVMINKEGGRLRFEHPTQPGLIGGGWMARAKTEAASLTNGHHVERTSPGRGPALPPVEVNMRRDGLVKPIQLEELTEHASMAKPWFVVNGEVYDGNGFMKGHPGGAQSIVSAAGTDITEEFMAIRGRSIAETSDHG